MGFCGEEGGEYACGGVGGEGCAVVFDVEGDSVVCGLADADGYDCGVGFDCVFD